MEINEELKEEKPKEICTDEWAYWKTPKKYYKGIHNLRNLHRPLLRLIEQKQAIDFAIYQITKVLKGNVSEIPKSMNKYLCSLIAIYNRLEKKLENTMEGTYLPDEIDRDYKYDKLALELQKDKISEFEENIKRLQEKKKKMVKFVEENWNSTDERLKKKAFWIRTKKIYVIDERITLNENKKTLKTLNRTQKGELLRSFKKWNDDFKEKHQIEGL